VNKVGKIATLRSDRTASKFTVIWMFLLALLDANHDDNNDDDDDKDQQHSCNHDSNDHCPGWAA